MPAYRKNRREYKYDPQYSEFRSKVRERDNHKCQWPNCSECKPNKLHCHHIRGWAKFPHLRYDPNNGILLCKTHHSLTIRNEDNFITLFMQIVAKNKRGNNV